MGLDCAAANKLRLTRIVESTALPSIGECQLLGKCPSPSALVAAGDASSAFVYCIVAP